MIISIRFKNFYSLRDDAVLDFTAESKPRKVGHNLPENLIDFAGDKFVNIIGMFGSNAAGKSNMIKAMEFCRNLVLCSHLNNEGDRFDFEPFKFQENEPSEFYIDFVSNGIEYEYSFELQKGKVKSESLYYYPNKRRAKVFSRENTYSYTHRKGLIPRPTEVETNTGPKTLFISRASSMNRTIAQEVYRFFLNEVAIGTGNFSLAEISEKEFDENKEFLLKALEVSDSDIVDIRLEQIASGRFSLRSYHRENPTVPFDFEKEESEGTKRLFVILLTLLSKTLDGATVFLDEFDLKLHLRLAEFVLDLVRASRRAQIVFTSHNPTLLDMTKLRSEQIVFVTKQADGNSEFVPLSDYEGLSKNADIQKAYLMGRFDAVPYIGDVYSVLAEMISQR